MNKSYNKYPIKILKNIISAIGELQKEGIEVPEMDQSLEYLKLFVNKILTLGTLNFKL